jgi:hypothetical protein
MKFVFIGILFLVLFTWAMYSPYGDGFKDWVSESADPYLAVYERAHGFDDNRIGAISGEIQQILNLNARHVNLANRFGNPQNIDAALKKQPLNLPSMN